MSCKNRRCALICINFTRVSALFSISSELRLYVLCVFQRGQLTLTDRWLHESGSKSLYIMFLKLVQLCSTRLFLILMLLSGVILSRNRNDASFSCLQSGGGLDVVSVITVQQDFFIWCLIAASLLGIFRIKPLFFVCGGLSSWNRFEEHMSISSKNK